MLMLIAYSNIYIRTFLDYVIYIRFGALWKQKTCAIIFASLCNYLCEFEIQIRVDKLIKISSLILTMGRYILGIVLSFSRSYKYGWREDQQNVGYGLFRKGQFIPKQLLD